ncbi:alkaline phosphatase D family protein [Phytohalomonas tamaricis]|uniref:alkaline phosphatase D family protein n=1 Tax=Phytohalomonas tamaricis TaxID=2081032 RepID=UPI000D0AE614|nr:alkaline phosphatase D family protein [Phytohalomonas tamaricis]
MAECASIASPDTLPDVLAGPLLRRLMPDRIVLWLAGSKPLTLRLSLFDADDQPFFDQTLDASHCRTLPVGKYAFTHLIDISLDCALKEDAVFGYDLAIERDGEWQSIKQWAPELCYDDEPRPRVKMSLKLDTLLHGSCRKPHCNSGDGLARADAWLSERRDTPEQWPSLLLMTGDQIYADDVAGPMLVAIHRLIERLGLFGERFEGAELATSDALLAEPYYYRREQLLPRMKDNRNLRERFFSGKYKPIFTSAGAQNHLITFAEMIAMYLLVWSPVAWTLIEVEEPPLDDETLARYRDEQRAIDSFVATLPQVRRALAQLPSYMIFDDHDITDDWNLTAAWETSAYEHPFSRRIIGNALIAYLLCQGWGNNPDAFRHAQGDDNELMNALVAFCRLDNEESNDGNTKAHDHAQETLIDQLITFEHWHYTLATYPKLVVLDTRTRRWRSERGFSKPSGLMDWEALSELQDALLDEKAVVMVSPAPVFGVKLIEAIQRIFIWLGKPLLVDAENWMSHRGAAYVMLNIFKHSKTPQNFVILSGDVHYSFAYDVHIRGHKQSPDIWQITSSGIKNTFPDKLLDTFDRLNRWLYAPWSPLNLLTKRRDMEVSPRQPSSRSPGERLVNKSGIGFVRLDRQGRPVEIKQLGADGDDVAFERED